jgi:tRNA-(ms[2]io[6]A)-hydroxylase
MLCLTYDTPAEWADRALADLPMLLSDHHALEIKAALMAEAVVRKWGDRFPKLAPLMAALSAEERGHADLVAGFLDRHGRPADPRRGNPYVQALRRRIAADGAGLLDLLLVNSLIEARSSERFRLLARAARGSELGRFYEDLYASEVGHYVLFTDLAADLFGEDRMKHRLAVLADFEGQVVRGLETGARIH